MKKLKVKTSTEYEILIGADLIKTAGEHIKNVCSGKALIISDSTVYPLYGETVKSSLESKGVKVSSFVFQSGEKSKNIETVTQIIGCLADNEFTRSDFIVALGGGVVGDVAGFVSAVYLRGIKFVQIPTTLLAAVDSSVGGKTGVDIPQGKNLVGAFHQPSLVICDTEVIKNLPKNIFAEGMAEVIKYGVIREKYIFEKILLGEYDLEDIIYRSVDIKRQIVENDEFDNGERQLLNLGHTFGHAVEKLSNLTVSHGQGVAIGMVLSAKFAYVDGVSDKDLTGDIIKMLEKVGLPTVCEFNHEDMISVMALDKKRRGDYISLILPEKIGKAIIKKYPLATFGEIFKKL